MWVAALRRLALLIVAAAGGTAAVSALVGVVLGASIDRSVSLGFYLAGSFLMVAGFFVGNRGPARVKSESAGGSLVPFAFFGARKLRWATLAEQNETISNSAVFVGLGLALVLLGILIDSRFTIL